MHKIPVFLSDKEAVNKFVDIIKKFEYHCELCCGNYAVDAKSLVGVAPLRGAPNLELIIHSEKPDKLIQSIEQYCC